MADAIAVIYQPASGTNVDVHSVTTSAGSGLVRPRTAVSDPVNDVSATVDANGLHVTNPSQAAASGTGVTQGGSTGAVKSTAGFLFAIVVQFQSSGSVTFTDGAGGKVIAVIPSYQPPGDVPLYGGPRPYTTGLYANVTGLAPGYSVFTNP